MRITLWAGSAVRSGGFVMVGGRKQDITEITSDRLLRRWERERIEKTGNMKKNHPQFC